MLAKRIHIKDALGKAGKEVVVAGWIDHIKSLGKIIFITLRDKTGKLQVVALKNKVDSDDFKALEKLTPESTIVIKGNIQESKAKNASHELALKDFEILTKSDVPLPIDMGDETTTNIDKRIDNRVLDTRRERVNAIFQIRSKLFKYSVDFFDKEGFVNINTPKITSSGAESGAELFALPYFDKTGYLAQSPQMYKQMFVMGGFERVYEIAPVFRAEKSHTTRHLTEFTGIDMEMGFIKDEHDVMDVVEELFKFVLKKVKEECKEELKLLSVDFKIPKKIPRIKHAEIRKLLEKEGKKISEDDDLDSEAEALLGKIVKKKYGEDFVFALNYPYTIRPFYHMKPDDDPKGTRSFDIIWNGVEIATGAQREHRYDVFIAQTKEKGVDIQQEYANIFRFGSIPHGGIGLGLDRMVHRLLNLDNVREAVLLPRDPERLTP
ncbi:MAG: aspartate--tRNA(Asn) ligase [Nanoarchaeota archaeon]|nr:aspartate--tRNA(Asn) ligase [Nanoarchaeota archaeon]MCG2718177.1 aspartate--tRNA(Asn) ligase [Nanoarchaeota archaeon]